MSAPLTGLPVCSRLGTLFDTRTEPLPKHHDTYTPDVLNTYPPASPFILCSFICATGTSCVSET
jgi:hypothetical protein